MATRRWRTKSDHAQEHVPEDRNVVGEVVGPYIVGDELGRGSSGYVKRAINSENGHFVAIKQFPRSIFSPEQFRVLEAEIDSLQRLAHHQNIVRVLDVIRGPAYLNLVLEYVESGSAAQIIENFGFFPEPLAALYISQSLKGLSHLHSHGIVHGGIKASNILISKQGQVKLADFGLTKAAELNVPYWSSPELLDGAAPGKPADIWALACTAMEFTTGAPPWAELQPATAAARLATSLPTPPGHASAELVAFLARCFVHDPAGRCTVDALLEDEWVSAVSPVIVEEAAAGAALPRQPAARPSKSDGPPSVVTSAGLVPSGGGPAGPVSGGAPVERMMIRVVMQLGEGESAKTIYVQRQITARALVSVILNKLSAYYNPEDYCIAEYHTTKEKQIFLDHEYPAQYYDSDQTLDFQLRIEPRPADMICGTLRRRRGRLMSRHWQTQYCVLDTHERYLAFYQRAPRPGEEALEPATDVIWDLTHIDSVVISSRDATRFAIECAGQVHHMAANSIDDALRWTNALRHASGCPFQLGFRKDFGN